MPSNMRPPKIQAGSDDHYPNKYWGSSPLEISSLETSLSSQSHEDSLWLFGAGRHLLNPQGHVRVAQANMGASRPPLRTLNVMEGIRQLHKATLLKTRLDALFAVP